MAQDPKKLINLSVHESSDPSLISPNPDVEADGTMNDLNDSVHDDENITSSQTTIANISAG